MCICFMHQTLRLDVFGLWNSLSFTIFNYAWHAGPTKNMDINVFTLSQIQALFSTSQKKRKPSDKSANKAKDKKHLLVMR